MRTKFLAILLLCLNSLGLAQSFKNPRRLALPVTPTAVMAGDLTGDGVPDLVYGTEVGTSAALHSLLADGKGGYAPGVDIALPAGVSTRCRLADMNGDKRLDLVCGGANAEVVAVLPGKGDGSFGQANTVNLPDNGGSTLIPAAVADLNGDGTPDLVVTTGGLQHYVLLNDGTGKLSVARPLASSIYGVSVQVADLNGDGHPDLLMQAGGSLNTEVQLGHGDGTFTRGAEYGGSAGAVLVDMDGDGHPDLVAGGRGILKIFHGNADGTFGTTPIATADYTDGNPYDESGFGVYLRPAAVLDLNGDGILDVLAYGDNGVTVLLGQPGLTFGAPRSFPVGEDLFMAYQPSTQQLLDMDGDGHPDFVSVGPNGVYISYGHADGSFTSADVYRSGYNVADIAVADFDEDGQPDVVTSGDVHLYLSKGKADGTFGPATAIATALPAQTNVTNASDGPVFHGDFNGDGHQDVLLVGAIQRGPAGQPVLLPGHGDGTFGPAVLLANFATGSRFLAVTDVNGDGRDDVIAEDDMESLTIYLAQADGTFRATQVSATTENSEAQKVTLGDLNGDGLPEIVFATGKELVVIPNMGSGSFGAPLRFPLPQLSSNSPARASSFAVGDFDGDGAPDVAVILNLFDLSSPVPSETQIVTFYRQGSRSNLDAASFGTAVTGPVADLVYETLLATDLDGDGRSDLVAVGSNYLTTNSVSTFLGRSDRTFGREQDFVAGQAFNSVALADLNRDGRPDVVVGNGGGSAYGDAFTVLLSQGAPLAPSAPVPTGTLVASPSPVGAGTTFTITATLKLSGVVANLNGTADFSVDGSDVGTVAFAGGVASVAGPTTLSPGVHQLSATTSALSGAGGTTYATLHLTGQVTVQALTSNVTMFASPNPAAVGQPVTVQVQLANGPGTPTSAPAPAGPVRVSVNGADVGSVASAASPGGGTLQYTFTSPGTYTVTASYTGDATHASSTASVTEVVQAVAPVTSDFTLGLSAPSVVVVVGQQGSVVARLGSLGTYAGTLQLADSNLPVGVTAAFSPQQVTLAAASKGDSTLSIAAGPAKSSAVRVLARRRANGLSVLSAVAFCGGVLPFGLRRRKARTIACAATLVLVGFGLQGCGFSGVPLITPGTYQVTVTATDTATHAGKSARLEVVIVTEPTQVPSAPNE